MAIQNIQALSEIIATKYESLEQPDFSFVSIAIASRPYDPVISQLQESFKVEEITDPNDDVSFRYLLSESKSQWVVELSMIGLYATVLRVSDVGPTEVVAPNTSIQVEQDICSLLVENQFEILDSKELELPFAIKLFNTAPENVCIYQALFSDTDVLPWKATQEKTGSERNFF